jgi:hypothetical protein
MITYHLRRTYKSTLVDQGQVAQACKPSYLGSRNLEDGSLRPNWAKFSMLMIPAAHGSMNRTIMV